MPESRCHFAFANTGNQIIVIGGGQNYGNNANSQSKNIFIYDFHKHKWIVSNKTLPKPNREFSMAFVNFEIHSFSGCRGSTTHNEHYVLKIPSTNYKQLQEYKYISKKQGKVYSKHGTSGKSKPDLILRLTHLNETISLFKINFNMSFNKFLDIYVRKYLLDLISNFDYFINSIDENKNISYTNNSLLSSKCKSGDVLIVRLRQNVPLPAKPDDDNDDAEIIPKMKTVNFNNNGNVTKTEIIQNKKEIKETIANKLLNIKASNKKLSKLMDIESFDNDNDEKNNDDEKKKTKYKNRL
eukprot:43568_1